MNRRLCLTQLPAVARVEKVWVDQDVRQSKPAARSGWCPSKDRLWFPTFDSWLVQQPKFEISHRCRGHVSGNAERRRFFNVSETHRNLFPGNSAVDDFVLA